MNSCAYVVRKKCLGRNISKISAYDQNLLNDFFYRILYREGLIYVLCGSKPMGVACYTSSMVPEMESSPINQTLKNGWDAWQRYKRFFPSKRFIFRAIGDEKKDCTIKILLINKDSFRNILVQNKAIFEEVLSSPLVIEDVLSRFENDPDPIESVLKNNHLLLGILYGFGAHNSKLFLDRWNFVEKQKNQFNSQNEMDEKLKLPPTQTLEKNVHPILKLPLFMADLDHPETIKLKNQYEKERSEILNKIDQDHLLELFLDAG